MGALDAIPHENAGARLLAPIAAAEQPPIVQLPTLCLHAAIGSLAIGGAERIVLDWAAAASRKHQVRLIVLRATPVEWPVPDGVEIIRLAGADAIPALTREGARIAATGNPHVLCHLLTGAERAALQRGGALPIPVLHNARQGWVEPAKALGAAPWLIAVSQAAAADLHAAGCRNVSVVRHIPPRRKPAADARRYWRSRWQVPGDAFVIGMIGGVKPQKAYPRALRMLAKLLARRDAWLVILGGPIGRDGLLAWQAVIEQCRRLDLCERVRLPGFLADASRALPAFDVVLNTSHYEGLSIATLEALSAGLPVIASQVGGQGELAAPGLHLVAHDARLRHWVDAIDLTHQRACELPSWREFKSARVWTLMHLPPIRARAGTLFVTANLNAGGAQRSLVNLAVELNRLLDLQIAVCGDSSSTEFATELSRAGVGVWRTASRGDAFDHAEALLRHAARSAPRTIVFWNVDAKVKLLVAKRLACSTVRLIDVSPGAYAFEEMDATAEFQRCIAYSAEQYYAHLQRLVLKYSTRAPVKAKVCVIPNGVALRALRKRLPGTVPRSIVVNGRIAPSKFLLEIVAAIRIVWKRISDARLHVLGIGEPRHHAYASALLEAAGDELQRRIFLHGAAFDAPRRLDQFDIALVIGQHQGCPNAVLEAMAAGLAVVANDSGGTRELVIDGRTGLLLADRDPGSIAAGLLRLMTDARLSERLARAGREHVLRRFSMRAMSDGYRQLLER